MRRVIVTAILVAASVAAQLINGTDTVVNVTAGILTVRDVENITLKHLNVTSYVLVQSAASGDAPCTLTIEDSTIGQLFVTAPGFRCRTAITRCRIGAPDMLIAVQFAYGDNVSCVVEMKHSILAGRRRAYGIPSISGQHVITNTTFTIGSLSPPAPVDGIAVWVSQRVTGALQLIGCRIFVSGFAWSGGGATSGIFVNELTGTSSPLTGTLALVDTVINVTRSGVCSGLHVGLLSNASLLVENSTIVMRESSNTVGISTRAVRSTCVMVMGTAVNITACRGVPCISHGMAATYIQASSFTVADSAVVTEGTALSQTFVDDSAWTARNVTLQGTIAWDFVQLQNGAIFITESDVRSRICFSVGETWAQASRGTMIVANNTLQCEPSTASLRAPVFANVHVLAQCNTLREEARHHLWNVNGYSTARDCGEEPSVLSLDDAPFRAVGALQACSTLGSIAPFSLERRNVEVTDVAVYENETFGTVSINGATSVVLRNCTMSKLLLTANAAGLQLLVDSCRIRGVHSATQVLGNVTIIDSIVGDVFTSTALSFPQGTSSTSTSPTRLLAIIRSNISATWTGAHFGTTHGQVNFAESQASVRGGTSVILQGIVFSGVMHGTVNITRSSVQINGTTTASSGIHLHHTRGGIYIQENTITVSTSTATATALKITSVETGGCVYVAGGLIASYSSNATAYGVHMSESSAGAVTLARGTKVKTDGNTTSYAVYVREMHSGAMLLVTSSELAAFARAQQPTVDARAFYLAKTSDAAIAVLESATLRSADGVCLYFPDVAVSVHTPGSLDLRSVFLAECSRNAVFQQNTSFVSVSQHCLRLPGPASSAVPVGDKPSTTVVPCTSEAPHMPLAVPVGTAPAAAMCAGFGSISPFRTPVWTTLTGTVSRSDSFLGFITIVDPVVVTLTNIQAVSITLTRSSDGPAPSSRVTIRDSTVSSINLASRFANMEFLLDRSTVHAADVTNSTPLLLIDSMVYGSFTIRHSTVTGRVLFNGPQWYCLRTDFVFHNTSFLSTPDCGGEACSVGTLVRFPAPLTDSKITFDSCSFRSARSQPTAPALTALSFLYLANTTVTINDVGAYLEHSSANTFVEVGYYRDSCVTITRTNTTQRGPPGSTLYFFSSVRRPEKSFLTLDGVQSKMTGDKGYIVSMAYFRYIDVIINNVTALMAVNNNSVSAFFDGRGGPYRAVVAMFDSRVTIPGGFVFRFPAEVGDTSLLTLRSTFNAPRVMTGSVTRLNAMHGCNVFVDNTSNRDMGRVIDNCSVAAGFACRQSSDVYAALDINTSKQFMNSYRDAQRSSNKSHDGGSSVWIVGPVLGGCFVLVFVGLGAFTLFVRARRDDNDGTDSNASVDGPAHEDEELRNFAATEDDVALTGAAHVNERNEEESETVGSPGASVSQEYKSVVLPGVVIHPVVETRQALTAVARGETLPPVAVPLPYVEYVTKSFERCRWRSPDGRSASFQAHDLYAGILYPYALSVTAYSEMSDVVKCLGIDSAAWARAIQATSGRTVYGACAHRAETATEGRRLMEQAGLRGTWMGASGTFFVYVVTPLEPERLSVQSLLADTASPTSPSLAQRQIIGAHVATMYSNARLEGVHCALHPAAVFVDPLYQTISLTDRRADGMPDEATAAAELLTFVCSVNPYVESSSVGLSVANVVAIAHTGSVALEPSVAFVDDGGFPVKVTAECSICRAASSSAHAYMRGVECCSPARHFVCEECINARVSAALTDPKADLASLPCAMAPACTSVWTFDDFGALVSPQNLRKWQRLKAEQSEKPTDSDSPRVHYISHN